MVHLHAFFQVGLLTGYIYAYLLARYLSSRRQVVLHTALLGASLFLLPITPDAALKPAGDDDPVWGIIRLQLLTVGGPYVLISSTGPLLQHWYRLTYADRSPCRLYALSNLGSLLGLISYPFLVSCIRKPSCTSIHLITQETLQLKHLRLDGILDLHVSNRHINLKPVVYGLGERMDIPTLLVKKMRRPEDFIKGSEWVLMT